jgi:outer membrane protein assembly factor BamB
MFFRAVVLALALVAPRSYAFEVAYQVPGGSEFNGLAVSGPNLLVADTVDGDRFESDAGIVSIYDGATGGLRGVLPNPDDSGSFGRALAANEQWIAVGAVGAVYVFDDQGNLVRTLRPDDPGNIAFGAEVALDGDLLAVTDDAAPASVHVFDMTTGALVRTLFHPESLPNRYGTVVAVTGNVVIMSSPVVGAVCALDVVTGDVRWCVGSPHPGRGERFGAALSVEGNALLVGAPGYPFDPPPPTLGAAYLLAVQTGAIRHRYHGLKRGAGFGTAVALRGASILIGAPDSFGKGPRTGKTFLIEKRSGRVLHTFRPLRRLDGYSGGTVAFVGTRIAIVDTWGDSDRAPVVRVYR